MNNIIYATPKQILTLFFEVFNSNQERTDAPTDPLILSIYNPNFDLLDGYPVAMTNIDVGLYSFTFTVPPGPSAIGTYVINIIWEDPDTLNQKQTYYQIICKSPPNAAGEYNATIPHL